VDKGIGARSDTFRVVESHGTRKHLQIFCGHVWCRCNIRPTSVELVSWHFNPSREILRKTEATFNQYEMFSLMFSRRKLAWRKHIITNRKQMDIKLRKVYWIICRKSQLSLENKLHFYKAILKPIWIYGVQLCWSTSNSNIDILERFQSKILLIITDAPWYVPNAVITRDLQVPTVRQDVRNYSVTYKQRSSITPTDWQVPYFKGHVTLAGSSAIALKT
jgi:hypothetical protein